LGQFRLANQYSSVAKLWAQKSLRQLFVQADRKPGQQLTLPLLPETGASSLRLLHLLFGAFTSNSRPFDGIAHEL